MKVRLLRKLRSEAMRLLLGYKIEHKCDSWEVYSINYVSSAKWLGNLMCFTVTNIMARSYRMDTKITPSFFEMMLRDKVFNLRWYLEEGYCHYIRSHYRKYTRKWKSAHGKKLGIRAENDWW